MHTRCFRRILADAPLRIPTDAALTPRGHAAVAIHRLRRLVKALDPADRAFLAPMLHRLAQEAQSDQ